MSKRILRWPIALALCALMTTGSAWAQGRRNGHGAAANQGWRADNNGSRGAWNDRDPRGDRDRWTFGNDQRPRGWDKGKKTGWGNCDVPPGQAKKMGCAPTSHVFIRSSHRSSNVRRDRDGDRDRDRHRSRNRFRDSSRDRRIRH